MAFLDPDGSIASYSWDFGDGSALGSGVGPVHVYTASGTYNVELTITDDQGLTGSGQSTVSVIDVNVPTTPPESPTGEELYNNYCMGCHGEAGTGGRLEDVAGESANDIAEAIHEERDMRFLADKLSGSDIKAIAEYLNGDRRVDDEQRVYNERRGDHKGRGDGHNRGNGHNRGGGKNDGGNGKGSSSNRSNNPFATAEEGSQAQSTGGDSGGGALDWLILLFSTAWVAIRAKRPW